MMAAIMTTSMMPFYQEIMTVFCIDNMSNNIQYGYIKHYFTLPQYVWRSHSQEP